MIHGNGMSNLRVSDPTELEFGVEFFSLLSDYLLDHVTELEFMNGELVQFVLVHNYEHKVFSGLLQLPHVSTSHFREGEESFFVDPTMQRVVEVLRFHGFESVGY